MLNTGELESQITTAWKNIVVPAIETCIKELFGQEGDLENETAKQFADTFDEMTSDEIGKLLANAIDYYVKNAAITGTIITTGSPFTQTAVISAGPTPITSGKIPNTLGIS